MTETPHRLTRMLTARDVAVVGASEKGVRSLNAIEAMTRGNVRLHLVNRRGEDVLGIPTSRSLTELADRGISIDAALLFTNAAAAIDVTAEAAALGVGGVIVNAGGFAESGAHGAELQKRLVAAAGTIPVIGPNCNGVVAPGLGLHLAGSPPDLPVSAGRIAFVTHSGATMMPMGIAGVERSIGYSYLVSTGNEAVVDMAEVVDYLATDPSTTAICLLIETIRRPDAFWAAVDRAIRAGKPVLALKNGRSSRGQAIAKSHTGAVAGEAWIYEAALRQHGVILANDLVDLADRVVLFDQVPREKWCAVNGLAVASGSGGFVTMASDVCAEEGLEVPDLDSLGAEIRNVVPSAEVVNPLDLTGAAMTDPGIMRATLGVYLGSDEVDAVLIQSAVADGAGGALKAFAGPALECADTSSKLIIVGSVEGGQIGRDLAPYRAAGLAVTRGLRATVRALLSMRDFMTFTPAPAAGSRPCGTAPLPRDAVIEHPAAGRMLGFTATMDLLTSYGVPVAPFTIIQPGSGAAVVPKFRGPYAVKLADVPHRSDIGAVRLGVEADQLSSVVEELRALAAASGEPGSVAVQRQYPISGELLVGVNGDSELGPLVVLGMGGIFVEIFRQVAGRLAPLGEADARAMVVEVNLSGVLDGPRGTPPWPTDALAKIVSGIGDLAWACEPWLESLDINPLALTPEGIVAVDGLVIVRDPEDA